MSGSMLLPRLDIPLRKPNLCYVETFQGSRDEMQDRNCVFANSYALANCIFDGHCGHETAEHLNEWLPIRILYRMSKPICFNEDIEDLFLSTDWVSVMQDY